MKKNPQYYKLEGQTPIKNSEQRLDDICERDINLLTTEGMTMMSGTKLVLTKFGETMAKYYIKLGTMRKIIKMAPKASVLELVMLLRSLAREVLLDSILANSLLAKLTVLSEAEEFMELRFRNGERSLYKEINKDNGLKYPVKEDISTSAHKVILLIQVRHSTKFYVFTCLSNAISSLSVGRLVSPKTTGSKDTRRI